MFLSEFIKRNQKPSAFARECGITHASLSAFLNGRRGLSAASMAKIVAYTGGKVTYADLVAEMQERQAERKKDNGNGKAADPVSAAV